MISSPSLISPSRLFSRTLFVLLALMLALPASAQYFGRNKVVYEDFDFRILQSSHFDLYYYQEGERAIGDAARMAERWYDRHTRVFDRRFVEKKPVIFYANDADFQQTNVIGGFIGSGTGGVTESLKERVVMPFTPTYGETDHVLGHELVHSFQYDIALRDTQGFSLRNLPLWLVEGMAEYLSVGREDPHTAMWLRDAALRDDLPTMEDLTKKPYEFFPYRYGQAYMAYVGGLYGDDAVTRLYKRAGYVGLDSAVVAVLGTTTEALSERWIAAVKDAYLPLARGRTAVDDVGEVVLNDNRTGGDLHIAPAVSPDGRYIAFLSERDLFYVNLFIYDTERGEIVRKLQRTGFDEHFDNIRFINSAGAWSPDGEKFAFVTYAGGDNELAIFDVDSEDVERTYEIDGARAILNPAWSPDGRTVAFSGMSGGVSDLYLLDLDSGETRRLTDDRYADIQPTWSPDGRMLAFATDRGPGGTDFETLDFAELRLGLLDLTTGAIETHRPLGATLHHNPQFSPDGRSVYFIGVADGFKDVHRFDLTTNRLYRVTNVQTGVSGISEHSPALSVAAESGRLVFSMFEDGNYTVHALDAAEAVGVPVTGQQGPLAAAGILPPAQPVGRTLVSRYLERPRYGLPSPRTDFDTRDYNPRISLDYVAPPTLGVSAGGPLGTGLVGGIGFYFSDMLGNHNLNIAAAAQGTVKDIGGQASYLNRANRFNSGVSVGHIPLRYGFGFVDLAEDPETGIVTQRLVREIRRIYADQASLVAVYPLSITRRFEVSAGAVRYGFDYELEETFIYSGSQARRETTDLESPDAIYLAQASAAFVGDFSFNGFTSPVAGGRYRFEVTPYLGSANYVRVLADARRYYFSRPVTFAVRGLHVGNYGANENDPFANQYLGYGYYPGFVRGYNIRSFESAVECTPMTNGDCAETERLFGTRIALASAEIRLPFIGTDQLGLINFPYLPTELSLFADAGVAWTGDDAPVLRWETDSVERVPVVSAGGAARINLLGSIVFELYAAYPFQRPEKGTTFGFRLVPGW